jgi:tetratricopeptide (TPR) repeat protein
MFTEPTGTVGALSCATLRLLSPSFMKSPYCCVGSQRRASRRFQCTGLQGTGESAVTSQFPPAMTVGSRNGLGAAQHRSGPVPPLADCFSGRPETGPCSVGSLAPGQMVVLMTQPAPSEPHDWPGGTGKTQFAAFLAESLWQARQIDLLVWVVASSRRSILASFAQVFAETMGMDPAGDATGYDTGALAARFVVWLTHTDQRWLVVLDDLADAADMDGLWPEGAVGRVLITTRNPVLASGLPGSAGSPGASGAAGVPGFASRPGASGTAGVPGFASPPGSARLLGDLSSPGLLSAPSSVGAAGTRNPAVFPVGPFSPHEALTYLMGRLSADPDQRMGAVDLLGELGCEPLALVQASATIASSGLTCRDYRDVFARRREQITKAAGIELPAKAITWTLSVEQADRLSPGGLVQPCLALAALLDGHGIPEAVFATSAACEYITAHRGAGAPDPKEVRNALLGLERVGLLTIDAASAARTVRVHPVVQAAVRSATPSSMRDHAARAAANALLEAWPADDAQRWLADALHCCVASLQQTAPGPLWTDRCHSVLFHAGRSLDDAGLTGPAANYWRALATISERVLGPGHPDTGVAFDRLAGASLAAGLGTEAVALYQRILGARASALGADHHRTLAARAGLGKALLSAGRSAEAITILEGVLAACEHGGGLDDLDILVVQDRLASAYQAAGRHPDAIRLGQRTLTARERRQGADHPDTMNTRGNLASTCLAAGKLKNAIEHGGRTLADRERVLGADHPDTISVISTLASAYHSARRLRDALPLYERALSDRERVQGPDHPDTLGARGNLASAYHSAGRIASALELYEQSRADCQRVLGAHHPDTLAARANLAHAYYAVGRVAEARNLLGDTLAECERVLPADDPLTVAVRESLDAVARG